MNTTSRTRFSLTSTFPNRFLSSKTSQLLNTSPPCLYELSAFSRQPWEDSGSSSLNLVFLFQLSQFLLKIQPRTTPPPFQKSSIAPHLTPNALSPNVLSIHHSSYIIHQFPTPHLPSTDPELPPNSSFIIHQSSFPHPPLSPH